MMAAQHHDPEEEPEEYEKLHKGLKKQCDKEKEEVLEIGGLHIVGTERHESRRIDNQLRGRAGRQGDPGSSQFYLSLEDDLMRIFGADRITGLMERLGMEEDVPIEAPLVNRAIENAQEKVEAMHFDTRKNLFEYDNVMNEQRKAIYALRKQILEGRYRPEILDDKAREEQQEKLPPPPEESGPHTIASLSKDIRERVTKLIDAHCLALIEDGAEPTREERKVPQGRHQARAADPRAVSPLRRDGPVREDRRGLRQDRRPRAVARARRGAHPAARARARPRQLRWCRTPSKSSAPIDVHPDDWEIDALEKAMKEQFHVDVSIRDVPENQDDLIDLCWEKVEELLMSREEEFTSSRSTSITSATCTSPRSIRSGSLTSRTSSTCARGSGSSGTQHA